MFRIPLLLCIVLAACGAPLPEYEEELAAEQGETTAQSWPSTAEYRLSMRHSGLAVDVEGSRTDDGALLQQGRIVDGPNQRFRLRSVGGGVLFEIVAVHSNKCLDVRASSKDDGAAIHQWTCHGGPNQRFRIVDQGDGSHLLRNENSGRCLDVTGESTTSGARLQQWSCHGRGNQRFAISPVRGIGPDGIVRLSAGKLTLNGRPYRFRGLNVYNANVVNWTCWYNLGEGDRLEQTLNRMKGSQNAFRAWFFQKMATNAGRRDFGTFDRTLAAAHSRGLKVVVTLGDQWDFCETGGYRTEAWYQAGYRSTPDPGVSRTYRDWVVEVVGRYKDHPAILMWQLMNEAEAAPAKGAACNTTAAQTLRTFAQDMSSLVKSIDRNHLVSMGTIGSGQCGSSWREYQDLHALSSIDVCEYHDYGHPGTPWPGDAWNGLRLRFDQCRALGKPLMIGESGIELREIGSAAMRAAAFDTKLREHFAQQVGGELIWHWCDPAYHGCDMGGYDIVPGDPTLGVLARY